MVSTLVHVGWGLLHCMRRDSGARSHAARNARCIGWVGCSRISAWSAWCVARRMASSMRTAGGRLRRACGALHSCAGLRQQRRRAPHGQGRRAVRRRGDIRHRSRGARGRAAMRVGADGRGRCGGGLGRRRRRVRLGCAQHGGVVSMSDGMVTFKGGTITNTKATVRT